MEEILHERRRQGFSSLEGLIAFLRGELAGGGENPSADEAWQSRGDVLVPGQLVEEVMRNERIVGACGLNHLFRTRRIYGMRSGIASIYRKGGTQ